MLQAANGIQFTRTLEEKIRSLDGRTHLAVQKSNSRSAHHLYLANQQRFYVYNRLRIGFYRSHQLCRQSGLWPGISYGQYIYPGDTLQL